ncbi:Uncharacterised protein [Chlamydia trachomatis]|nr:Uncharacterised protein [Chlamydia trachomatis]
MLCTWTIVGVDDSVTLSSADTLILSEAFSVFVGTFAVAAGLSDAVSAGFALNTPVAPATEREIMAMIAIDNPAVCGLWDLTHCVSLFIKNLLFYKFIT